MNIAMQIKLNKISLITAEIFKKLGKDHRFEPIFWEIFKNLLNALCTFLHAFKVHVANRFFLFKEHVHSIKVSKYFKTPI